jgi:hypothetical protein
MTVNKQDSNSTGLRYAEESSTIGVLPGTPLFYEAEPNSFKDFGGQLSTVARKPITNTRQRRKGTATDLDASGGWNQDWTLNNLTRLLQGFFFADLRQKGCNLPLNGTQAPVTATDSGTKKYTFTTNSKFLVGSLMLASGFASSASNGLKHVTAKTGADVTVSEAIGTDASPPATALLQVVGHEGASGDITMDVTGTVVSLQSTTLDFTTLNLKDGEWIYIGGDAAGTHFAGVDPGVARIALGGIAAHKLTLDKTEFTAADDTGTGKTIQLFFGNLLRNEPQYVDIKRRSYHLERTLGEDDDGTMTEYLKGAVANELTVNVPQADKINMDLSFVATDHEIRSGAEGAIAGTRIDITSEDAINTSSDIARIKLALVSTDAAPVPLFAYASDMNVSIKNNASPNKAIGVLGAFNISAGTFEVGGKLTVYFADAPSVKAVRNNADVTLDMFVAKNNAGLLLDIPLLALGDGRLAVEQDKPISLPLDTNASESPFGYTAALMFFPYLPSVAM